MTMSRLLCPAPLTITPEIADDMASIVDREYLAVTGHPNIMETICRKGCKPQTVPVVCATTSGMSGCWSIACNDPDFPSETLARIITNIRERQKAGE